MTSRQLRAAVALARGGKKRVRISGDLKSELSRYSGSRREAGATWEQIGQELGLSARQVRLACRDRRGPRAGRLLAVKVVADPLTASTEISLTLSGGEVVLGLNVSALAALLREVR